MGHSFFEVAFPDVTFSISGNTQVCCPFPHIANGVEYFETNPSAGIDISKGVFHCFSCQRGFSEITFAAEYLGCSYDTAVEIVKLINNSESAESWKYAEKNLWENYQPQYTIIDIGLSKETAQKLRLGYQGNEGICFPVIMFGRLLDVVTYRPNKTPKYLRKPGSKSGLIIPYDLWKADDKKNTIICAGEKDMAIARNLGFNAINFTGGEQSIPKLFLHEFKNRKVYIIYDNDQAGKDGARKLAMHLQPIAEEVYIVDLSETCTEKGEDLWDFFKKYNKTREDLIELMRNTKAFSQEDYQQEKNKHFPIVSLHEATQGHYIGKTLRSNVQVVATMDNTYLLPVMISSIKTNQSEKKDRNYLKVGDKRVWSLNEWNLKDMFYLIDSNLKEKQIEAYIKTELLKIPAKEDYISIKQDLQKPVYKSVVSDLVNSADSTPLTEFVCYSIDYRLETGKKYLITYRLVPHPQDGQKLMMVVNDVEDSDDFLNNFQIDEAKKASLKKFQVPPMTKLEDKFNDTIQRVKGILNADYNDMLITIIDLWFHSVLEFNVGKFKNIRGYLDTLIVGESRVGKSSTVEALQRTYQVGKIVSLAGGSATVAGLIGGSNKVGGNFQTRAGIIPQNHKGAIIFEELAKSKGDIIKELTDVRSSGKARIVRVNGSIELPALVRMLMLTNSKTHGSTPRPISSYPNGIAVLTDLVGTAEDIARFDIIAIFGFDANKSIDPFFEPLQPYTDEDYQTRIRWIWSRTADQIIISQEIYEYTLKHANLLNKKYDSHIKIFGIETWKKILRLATAIAGYVCSTDETFENIIVQTSHVDLAVKILLSLYINDTFRFDKFVEEERRLKEIDAAGIKILQDLYEKNPTLLTYLMNSSETTRSNLAVISGTDNETFSRLIHELVANLFITVEGFSITPTERFRKGMTKINTEVKIQKVGEVTIKFD